MSTVPESRSSSQESTGTPLAQPLPARTYLIVSAVGLVLSIGLLLFLVFGAQRILAAGLDHRVFYVLLVPLGLSAAAFAFGAMNSSGTFTAEGTKRVGLAGPAMFAALVVVGGFFLVPDGGLHTLAVRVDSASGGSAVAGARVTLDWGAQRLTQVTDENGQASFLGLPRGASDVRVSVEAAGYLPTSETFPEAPSDPVVRLALEPAPISSEIRGTVLDRTGSPLSGVYLSFDSGLASDTTDAAGNFSVTLPRAPGARVGVIGTRDGVAGMNTEFVVTEGTPITLRYGN